MRLMPATDYECARLYRTPDEILTDISTIADCIENADMRMSIHGILVGLATEINKKSPDSNEKIKMIEESADIISKAMRRMERLYRAMCDLVLELEEAKWARVK